MGKIKDILLSPLAFLWEWIYRIRRMMYDYNVLQKSHFEVPVISVGNLTFGGTGKTPFTIWLVDYLNKKGLKSLILTRGYKGKFENGSGMIRCGGIFRVNPSEYGDEPALMDRKLQDATIIVGKNRSQNLRFYYDQVQSDVVVLDDGFQHINLHRNFDVVLFDASLPIERYKIAPRGYLREGMTALKDADAIIINAQPWVDEDNIVAIEEMVVGNCRDNVPVSRVAYEPQGLFNGSYQKVYNVEQFDGVNAVLVAGLASPGSFYKFVESLGINIVKSIYYPDHHDFTVGDIDHILTSATQEGCVVITTEKDIVKIRRISTDARIMFLDIDVVFTKNFEGFISKLSSVIPVGQESVLFPTEKIETMDDRING